MTYIGQQPSTTFDSGIQDRFTGLTTNTVTLTHDISAETDILVVWNNIVQDSSTYSVGGVGNKTLTLGGTLSSGDVVTVYYTNRVMQSVSPTAGSVQTLSINDGAVTNAKLANSSVSINGSSVSLGGSITGIGESNIPNFHANQASTSISNNVGVTVVYSNEVWDTASLYNTSTGKILQVVTNPVADTSADTVDTGSWEAIPLSVALTPSATSSKINVSASVHYEINAINTGFSLNIYRDIGGGGYSQIRDLNSFRISKSGYAEQERLGFWSYSTTFSPSTTSAVTFKLYGITGGSAVINLKTLDLTAMEIGV